MGHPEIANIEIQLGSSAEEMAAGNNALIILTESPQIDSALGGPARGNADPTHRRRA
jgi:hypothetical protein